MGTTDQDMVLKLRSDMGTAIKEVKRLSKELDSLHKSSKKNTTTLKQNEAAYKKIGGSVSKLTTQLKALAVSYASIQGARALVGTAADIEEAFLGVAKTTGLAGEEFDELKDSILDLSTELAGISLEELQSIAETAGQLGIAGKENILEFTKVIAMIGATTELSAEQAATGMAKLGNSMKVPVSEFENLGSVINELSNTTTATAGDLLDMGQRISGVGKVFGLTADEVLGLSATLTDVGMSAELGGTAISKVMLEMTKDSDAFAKAVGLSMNEFSIMVKEKPVEALQTFITALGNLDKSAKIKALDDLKLTSSGTVQTLLKLSGATDTLTKNLKTAGEEWKNNTSLQKEYSIFSEGFNAQMDKVGNTIKKLAYKIGEELLPALKKVAEDFANWVNSLDEAKLAEFGKDIAGVAKALADVAGALGSFITAIGSFVTNYPTLSKGLLGLIVALKTINFLLPTVGTAMVAMGTKSAALGVASGTLTTSIGLLSTAARGAIALAGPWGLAFAAMGTAATVAFNAYEESVTKTTEANRKSAESMNTHADAIHGIGDSMLEANRQMEEHGRVTKKTRDDMEASLKKEIAAIEKELSAWERNTDSTEEQNKAALQLAGTLGSLKASLDVLDAVYTIDMRMETEEANKAVEETKSKAAEPVTSELGFNPDTSEADTARVAVAKPIRVPVTYVPTNKPPRSGYAEGGYVDGIRKVKQFAGGGLIPQRLAEGGTFTGSGKVPGNDPTDSDKVNARLTGGEVVIKRSAVARAGVDNLLRINAGLVSKSRLTEIFKGGSTPSFNMPKMPNIHGYADGGLVGSVLSSPSAASPSPQLQPINLTVAGTEYKMMSHQEVADALQRNLEITGGM